MSEIIKITTPLDRGLLKSLRAGRRVHISGTIYTARDMAHKRLCEAIRGNQALPIDIKDALIYYVGPTPARPGRIIGAAGPTTSSRMDSFAPVLFANGLAATMGKGYRNQQVREALTQYGGIHLAALGGAGALLSRHIVEAEIAAYEDLGTEAIRRLRVVDFPAVVAYDSHGQSVYDKDKPNR